MKKLMTCMMTVMVVCIIATAVCASDLVIYPAKGQSQEQLEKDKFDCYTWAKGQTGFDPMQVPKASAPPPQQTQSESNVVRGAARGALLGTAVGAIAGDTGKGAAIGAVTGGAAGGAKKRQHQSSQAQAQQQWEREQTAEYAAKRNNYDRNYAACLEGKGYTVK